LNQNKIYGFYFVGLINEWEPIVTEQLNKIYNSELYFKTNKLFIRVYYTDNRSLKHFKSLIKKDNKIIVTETNQNEYEFGSLKTMRNLSKTEDFYCYYLHSKGVSRKGPKTLLESVRSWRHYMEYFLFDRYMDCIKEIDLGSDAVGVKLRITPFSGEYGKRIQEVADNLQKTLKLTFKKNGRYEHFSGNFWWSHSKFIRTLPEIDFLDLNERHHAEFWIGYTKGNLKSLHNSEQAGYRSVITENYKIDGETTEFIFIEELKEKSKIALESIFTKTPRKIVNKIINKEEKTIKEINKNTINSILNRDKNTPKILTPQPKTQQQDNNMNNKETFGNIYPQKKYIKNNIPYMNLRSKF
jgi:hypothetical protein